MMKPTAEYQRDSDDDAEEPELLRHIGDVERRREGGLGYPRVAGAVRDRLAALVLRGRRLVACALGSVGSAAAT